VDAVIRLLGVVVIGFVLSLGFWVTRAKPSDTARITALRKEVRAELAAGSRLFAGSRKGEAELALTELVERRGSHTDLEIQDDVAKARMTLGYIAAERKDWKEAERRFRTASAEYRGTGDRSADFGKIDDQAEYQALVAIQADGRKSEAVDGYLRFVRERPYSPLVRAAHRRLCTLRPQDSGDYDKVLDSALKKQQDKARQDVADCGPKVVRELLRRFGPKEETLDVVRKSCGTDERGTSMLKLRRALSAFGWKATGRSLTGFDFMRIKVPAVFFAQDHYFLITKNDGQALTCFDPYDEKEHTFMFDEFRRDGFKATVLTLEGTGR